MEEKTINLGKKRSERFTITLTEQTAKALDDVREVLGTKKITDTVSACLLLVNEIKECINPVDNTITCVKPVGHGDDVKIKILKG